MVRRKPLHRRALMLIQHAAGTAYVQDAFSEKPKLRGSRVERQTPNCIRSRNRRIPASVLPA